MTHLPSPTFELLDDLVRCCSPIQSALLRFDCRGDSLLVSTDHNITHGDLRRVMNAVARLTGALLDERWLSAGGMNSTSEAEPSGNP